MTHHEYWIEAVQSSLGEHCIEAGDLAIVAVADDMMIAHEQHGMAFGHDVATDNVPEKHKTELANLRAELKEQCAKVWCKGCGGGPARRDCRHCNGKGYVNP